MYTDKRAMIGKRPIASRLGLRIFAFVAVILFMAASFSASAWHSHSAQSQQMVRQAGEAAYTAQTMRGGAAMPCCHVDWETADSGSGCSAPSCASASGVLGEPFTIVVSARPLRALVAAPPGSLSPYYPIPEHGPPRA